MNGEHYASMLAVGYSLTQWFAYISIANKDNFGDPKPIVSDIKGSFDTTKGTVTCIIPKSTIGYPTARDILTKTQSQCFQRFGLWGRLGFSSLLRYFFFNAILDKWQFEDIAPDFVNGEVVYGRDHVIQY